MKKKRDRPRTYSSAVAEIISPYADRNGEYASVILYGKQVVVCEGDDDVWADFTGLTTEPRIVVRVQFKYGKEV